MIYKYFISIVSLLFSGLLYSAQLPITIYNLDGSHLNQSLALNFASIHISLKAGDHKVQSSPSQFSFNNIDANKNYQLKLETDHLTTIETTIGAINGVALVHEQTQEAAVILSALRLSNQMQQALTPIAPAKGNCQALPDGQIQFNSITAGTTCMIEYSGQKLVEINPMQTGQVIGYFSTAQQAESGTYRKQIQITLSEIL